MYTMKTDYVDLYFPDPELVLDSIIDHILFIVFVVHVAKFFVFTNFHFRITKYCEHTDEEHVDALNDIFIDSFTIYSSL